MAPKKKKDFDDGYRGIFEDGAVLELYGKPKKANLEAAKKLKAQLKAEGKLPKPKKKKTKK